MHLHSLQLYVGWYRRAPPRTISRQPGLNVLVCGQAFKNETDACARARADRMRIYYCREKSLTDKCPSQKSTIYFIQIVSEHTHIPARAYCDGRQHHRLQSAAPCAHCLPSPYTCRRLTSDTRDRAAQIVVPGGRRQTSLTHRSLCWCTVSWKQRRCLRAGHTDPGPAGVLTLGLR